MVTGLDELHLCFCWAFCPRSESGTQNVVPRYGDTRGRPAARRPIPLRSALLRLAPRRPAFLRSGTTSGLSRRHTFQSVHALLEQCDVLLVRHERLPWLSRSLSCVGSRRSATRGFMRAGRLFRLRHNSKRSSACDSPLRTLPDAAASYTETPAEIRPSGPRESPPVSSHTETTRFPYDPETWSAAEVPSHPGIP